MRAILVNASDALIEERRRLGIDKLDELWKGEWHLVNPPKRWHGRLNTELLFVLGPHAERPGLVPYGDAAGIFAASDDWRVPDQLFVRPEDETDEGVAGAALVVEVRSPDDDTYLKLPFYAGRGVTEVLVVEQDRRFELYRLGPNAEYGPGGATSSVLGVTFTTVEGPRLRVSWEGGSAEV